MIEVDFTIIEPKPPLFNRIVVSLVFTVFIAYVHYLVSQKIVTEEMDVVMVVIYMVWFLGVIIMMTVGSISRHGIQFNFGKMKIRHIYDISIFRYKEKWQDLNDLNYLSVYKEGSDYNIIMWYEEHSYLNLFSLKSFEDIVAKACLLSDRLNIDLLDATINDELNHWIDKKTYKLSGETTCKAGSANRFLF